MVCAWTSNKKYECRWKLYYNGLVWLHGQSCGKNNLAAKSITNKIAHKVASCVKMLIL